MSHYLAQELIFEVTKHQDGAYSANCLNASIRNAGGTDLEEFHQNLSNAIDIYYGDHPKPTASQVHLLVYDE